MEALECIHNLLSAGILSLFCLLCYLVHKCCCDVSSFKKCICPVREFSGQITPSNNIIVPRPNDDPIKLPLHQFLSQAGSMDLEVLSMPCRKCCESSCNLESTDVSDSQDESEIYSGILYGDDPLMPTGGQMLSQDTYKTGGEDYSSEVCLGTLDYTNADNYSKDDEASKKKHNLVSFDNKCSSAKESFNKYSAEMFSNGDKSESQQYSNCTALSRMETSFDNLLSSKQNSTLFNTICGKYKHNKTGVSSSSKSLSKSMNNMSSSSNQTVPSKKSQLSTKSTKSGKSTKLTDSCKSVSGGHDSRHKSDKYSHSPKEKKSQTKHHTKGKSSETRNHPKGKSSKTKHHRHHSKKEHDQEEHVLRFKIRVKGANSVCNCNNNISDRHCKVTASGTKIAIIGPSYVKKYLPQEAGYSCPCQSRGPKSTISVPNHRQCCPIHHCPIRSNTPRCCRAPRVMVHSGSCPHNLQHFGQDCCCSKNTNELPLKNMPDKYSFFDKLKKKLCDICCNRDTDNNNVKPSKSEDAYVGQLDDTEVVYDNNTGQYIVKPCSANCKDKPSIQCPAGLSECRTNSEKKKTPEKSSRHSARMNGEAVDEIKIKRLSCCCDGPCPLHVDAENSLVDSSGKLPPVAGEVYQLQEIGFRPDSERDSDSCSENNSEWGGSQSGENNDHITGLKDFSITRLYEKYSCDNTFSQGSSIMDVFADPLTRLKRKYGTPSGKLDSGCGTLSNLSDHPKGNVSEEESLNFKTSRNLRYLNCDFVPGREPIPCFLMHQIEKQRGLECTCEEDEEPDENEPSLSLIDKTRNLLSNLYSSECSCEDDDDEFYDSESSGKTKLRSVVGDGVDSPARARAGSAESKERRKGDGEIEKGKCGEDCDGLSSEKSASQKRNVADGTGSTRGANYNRISSEDEDCPEDCAFSIKDLKERTKNWIAGLYSFVCDCDDDEDEIFYGISNKDMDKDINKNKNKNTDKDCKPACPFQENKPCPTSCINYSAKKNNIGQRTDGGDDNKCPLECDGYSPGQSGGRKGSPGKGKQNRGGDDDCDSVCSGISGKRGGSPKKGTAFKKDNWEDCQPVCPSLNSGRSGGRAGSPDSNRDERGNQGKEGDDECYEDCDGYPPGQSGGRGRSPGRGKQGTSGDDDCDSVCSGITGKRGRSPVSNRDKKGTGGWEDCQPVCPSLNSGRSGGRAGSPDSNRDERGNQGKEGDDECYEDCDGYPPGQSGGRGRSPGRGKQGTSGDDDCDSVCSGITGKRGGSPVSNRDKKGTGGWEDCQPVCLSLDSGRSGGRAGSPDSNKDKRGKQGKGEDDECYSDCDGYPPGRSGSPASNRDKKRNQAKIDDDECDDECDGYPGKGGGKNAILGAEDECTQTCPNKLNANDRENQSKGYSSGRSGSPVSNRANVYNDEGDSYPKRSGNIEDCEPACSGIDLFGTEDECTQTCPNKTVSILVSIDRYDRGISGQPTGPGGNQEQGEQTSFSEREGSPTSQKRPVGIAGDACDDSCDKSGSPNRPGTRAGSPASQRGQWKKPNLDNECSPNCDRSPTARSRARAGSPVSERGQGKEVDICDPICDKSPSGRSGIRAGSPVSQRGQGKEVDICDPICDKSPSGRSGTRAGSPVSQRGPGREGDICDPICDSSSKWSNSIGNDSLWIPDSPDNKGQQTDASQCSPECTSGRSGKNSTGDCQNCPAFSNKNDSCSQSCPNPGSKIPKPRPETTPDSREQQKYGSQCSPECSSGRSGKNPCRACPAFSNKDDGCSETCPNAGSRIPKITKPGSPTGILRNSLTSPSRSPQGTRGRGSILNKTRLQGNPVSANTSLIGRSSSIVTRSPMRKSNSSSYSVVTAAKSTPSTPGGIGRKGSPLRMSPSHIYGKRRPDSGSCSPSCGAKRTSPSRPISAATPSALSSPTMSKSNTASKISSISRLTDLDDDRSPNITQKSYPPSSKFSEGCSTLCTAFSSNTTTNDGMSHYSDNNQWCNCDDVCTKNPTSSKSGTRGFSKRSPNNNLNTEVSTTRKKNYNTKDDSRRCSICCNYLTESNNAADPRGRCAQCCEAIRERMKNTKTEQQRYLETLPSKSKSTSSFNTRVARVRTRSSSANPPQTHPISSKIDIISTMKSSIEKMDLENVDVKPLLTIRIKKANTGDLSTYDDEFCVCSSAFQREKEPMTDILAKLRADPTTSWPQEFEGTTTQPLVIDRYHISLEETEQICPMLQKGDVMKPGDLTAQYGKFQPYKKNEGEIPESKPCPCGKHYCYPVPPNFDTFVRVYHQVPDEMTDGPSTDGNKNKCSPTCSTYGKPHD